MLSIPWHCNWTLLEAQMNQWAMLFYESRYTLNTQPSATMEFTIIGIPLINPSRTALWRGLPGMMCCPIPVTPLYRPWYIVSCQSCGAASWCNPSFLKSIHMEAFCFLYLRKTVLNWLFRAAEIPQQHSVFHFYRLQWECQEFEILPSSDERERIKTQKKNLLGWFGDPWSQRKPSSHQMFILLQRCWHALLRFIWGNISGCGTASASHKAV